MRITLAIFLLGAIPCSAQTLTCGNAGGAVVCTKENGRLIEPILIVPDNSVPHITDLPQLPIDHPYHPVLLNPPPVSTPAVPVSNVEPAFHSYSTQQPPPGPEPAYIAPAPTPAPSGYAAGYEFGSAVGDAIANLIARHRIHSYCDKHPLSTMHFDDGSVVDCAPYASADATDAVRKFLKAHPEYYKCPENAKIIFQYLEGANLVPSKHNLELAYRDLSAAHLLRSH